MGNDLIAGGFVKDDKIVWIRRLCKVHSGNREAALVACQTQSEDEPQGNAGGWCAWAGGFVPAAA